MIDEAESSRKRELIAKPIVEHLELEKAVALLRKSERPLIVFGKGAVYARAENALQKLVESIGIPFLPTPMGKGLLTDTHEIC